jgi:serine/threonine-protein kinase
MAHPPESLVGGRYRLGDRLGEGGFGAVYSAVDTQLRRPVAVKLLDPESGSRDRSQARLLRERFRREAIATAAIDHPNVVTVFDVGIADEGDVYIVMELLEGRALGEELQLHPNGLAADRAIPHFVQCLEALGRGHSAGIVHKDLKPSNLFLAQPETSEESMRVIDFGVARVLHEEKLTATGRIVGTPRYLAPEYIEEHEVTPALDVYQMALILVETLSGHSCVPRGLDLVGCCQMHLAGDLRIPRALLEGRFGDVLLRATAIDPADRFEDGTEFSQALAAIDPATVQVDRGQDERATPRLGSSAVGSPRKRTAPLHGGVAASPDAGPHERSDTRPDDPPTRTTLDVGPSSRAEKVSASDEEPVEDAAATVQATAPAPRTVAAPSPAAPRSLRGLVYGLVAVALVSMVATAFLVTSRLENERGESSEASEVSPAAAPSPSEESPSGPAATETSDDTAPAEESETGAEVVANDTDARQAASATAKPEHPPIDADERPRQPAPEPDEPRARDDETRDDETLSKPGEPGPAATSPTVAARDSDASEEKSEPTNDAPEPGEPPADSAPSDPADDEMLILE